MRVKQFVQQKCIATESGSVSATDLYAAYYDWCKHDMGWLAMSRDSFDNQLKRLGHNVVDGVVVGIDTAGSSE